MHIPLGLRWMALVCRVCPCCIVARRWPNSAFARKFKKVQHVCPFCRAHEKVKILIQAEEEPDEPVPIQRSEKANTP